MYNRKEFLFTIICLSFMLISASSLLAENCQEPIVDNFDVRGFKDWKLNSSGGTITYSEGYKNQCVLINRSSFGGDDFTRIEKDLPVEAWAGKSIMIEAWVKAENIKPGKKVVYHHSGHIDFEVFNSNYQPYYPPDWGRYINTFDWKHVVYKWSIPKDAVRITVRFGLQGATGSIYFDEIKIYKCDN